MYVLYYLYEWSWLFFFFKQKTAYEMRISDWSSDVCSSDLADAASRNIFAGILIQMGNQKLAGSDKTGADPLYQEALALARKSVAENAQDAVSRNILLSALIGASQTGNDPALSAEALNTGKEMQIGRATGRKRVCQKG